MNILRKLGTLSVLLIIGLLVISGCSKRTANAPKDDPVISTETENAGGSLEHGDGYGFNEFELEIEFSNDEEIEIDFDVTKEAKASFKNTLQNLDLKDNEAMDKIGELFDNLLLNKDMPDEEVIEKILDFYEVENYSKFELEVDFDEGTKLRIKDKK